MKNEMTKYWEQALTRRAALKRFGVGIVGLALARLGLKNAEAITNGALDGDAHPGVGGFVWLKSLWPPLPPPLVIGSGSLIHPRVVLTAGHATYLVQTAIASGAITMDDLLFSFASDANNPGTWRGISEVITHPDFNPKLDSDGNAPLADVGVAILKEPVTGIAPLALPPLGFLDELEVAGILNPGANAAKFTVVGYGAGLGENPGHPSFPPDGLRRVVESAFRNLHERWMFLDQSAVHDLGGTAAGDSGGPTLWIDPSTGAANLVAITSRGNESLDLKYRVDTAEAHDFLEQFLASVNSGEL